jgi:hypothetical protein
VGADINQNLREYAEKRLNFMRKRIKYLSDISKGSKESVD